MKLGRLLIIGCCIFSLDLPAVKHSDEEMRKLINMSSEALENIPRENMLFNIRCPYSNMVTPDETKIKIVNQGYLHNLYSQTVRDKLKEARLYPIISSGADLEDVMVYYLCTFE